MRMDLDTMQKKGAHFEMYERFKNHEADILIGTQMIAKGFDFRQRVFGGRDCGGYVASLSGLQERRTHIPAHRAGGRSRGAGRDEGHGGRANLCGGALCGKICGRSMIISDFTRRKRLSERRKAFCLRSAYVYTLCILRFG